MKKEQIKESLVKVTNSIKSIRLPEINISLPEIPKQMLKYQWHHKSYIFNRIARRYDRAADALHRCRKSLKSMSEYHKQEEELMVRSYEVQLEQLDNLKVLELEAINA